MFSLRQTHDTHSSSVENVFSSQNITLFQNSWFLSLYSRVYSIRCSITLSVSSGFRAGLRPRSPLAYNLFLIVWVEQLISYTDNMDVAGVNGSASYAPIMVRSWSGVGHRGRPHLGLSVVLPLSANLLIHRATVWGDIPRCRGQCYGERWSFHALLV